MSYRTYPMLLAMGAATAPVFGQSPAPTPVQPPAAHSTSPIQSLDPVSITASPLGSSLLDMADPVNVLSGRQLLLKRQPTLGETLESEVGVSSTYFGPNASRPVIRGLGGYDIRLLNNGLGLIDASGASPDHAVAVSPFAVERIEVVRGPATVLYGGAAIGGVVNTIDSRIPERPGRQPVSGSASYTYNSPNNLSAGGARIDGGNERFGLHADAYATRNRNLSIPGAAWTPEIQAARGEPGPSGELPNSQGQSNAYGVGGSAFFDQRGYLGASYSQFSTNYGTVAEPDVTIDLKQHAWNLAGELRDTLPGLSALRLKAGYNDYEHTEFEGGEAATRFMSNGWNFRVEGQHHAIGPFRGVVGAEAAAVDFSALGAEAFLPSTTTRNLAGFIYEELQRGAFRLALGARVESVKVNAGEFEAAGQPADSVSFTPWSGAIGAFYNLSPQWGVGANFQYTERAPAAQELFANGAHAATNQFEVGNRNLAKVRSTAVDVALRRRGDGWSGVLSGFYSDFSRYIGLFPTGIYRNPEDRSVASGPQPIVDPVTGEEVVPLQQFDFQQVPARFYGFELQGSVPLLQQEGHRLSLGLQADYVRAENADTGEALPFIPPLRAGLSFTYQVSALTATVGAQFAARQDRVPQFQTTTPGYTNLYFNASYRFGIGGGELEAFIQATNLLDQTIRFSTSSLKDIAPAAARGVMVGLRGTL